MGLLKKLTKPLSKFLDKIIPNEIKPALPYLSAFAPFMMGPGIMGSSMLQRGLMSGGANLLSQLAQEGSEGDVDWLSAALAGGIGSLTAPGTAGGRAIGDTGASYSQYMGGDKLASVGSPSAVDFFAGKADVMNPGWMKSGTEMLGKGAKYLTDASTTLQNEPFTKAGLKAALVPATTGTADLARISAEQELKRLNDEEEETGIGINDEGRRRAIRAAMEAGGHSEEAILDALASLGLIEEDKAGGIVGLKHGGQLVKRGPGRPGYGGPHETEAAGRAYEAATSPGGGGGDAWQRQALQQFAQLSPTTTGGGITANQPIKYGERYNPNLNFGVNIGKGLNPKDLAALFSNYYQTPTVDETDPNTWDYGLQNITTPDVSVEDVTVTTPDSTIDEVTEVATDKNFWENIQDITNRTQNQIIDMQIAGELKKGGRVGYRERGFVDPNDYPQQEDVGTFELQQEEGVPIGPMVQEDKQKQLLKAFAEYQAGGGKLSLKQFAAMWIRENAAGGGRINKEGGGVASVLPRGTEADYRGGGVIPVGSRERADDVPARLSKNEFVMTADAVKAAGGGSVNRGAKKMYNLMHNLEARV